MDLDTLWDFDDAGATEARFRSLLGSTEVDQGELKTQIARSLGLQGKFEEAGRLLDTIEPSGERVRVRTLLERGRILNSSGKSALAVPLFAEAADRARDCGELGLQVDALHMLGIADEPDRRLQWHLLGLEIAETSGDERARKWRGSLLNNIGWYHFAASDFDKALEAFESAVQEREANGPPRRLEIARWCVGRCLRALGRTAEALAIMRSLEAGGTPDGYVNEELAYLLQGDEAAAQAGRALAALPEEAFGPARVEALKALASQKP